MDFIPRHISAAIDYAKPFYGVIVITGPRQVGKTTLARRHFQGYQYYNLDDVAFRQAVSADPKGFLAGAPECVIIDEVQHVPELLSYIQIEVDNNPERKFVLTGSSNFALLENVTQSLAGRAALFTLLPFSMDEVKDYVDRRSTNALLIDGLYPGVVVRKTPADLFYQNYYSTYIERDVRQIKPIENLSSFQMFVKLLAGRVGTEFNASSLATEVGVSAPTIKSWLTVLQASYIVFPLRPFFANISKRLVKSPKIYFYDSGLLCFLLGITAPEHLEVHPLRGGIFENLVVSELLKRRFNAGKLSNMYFYRENRGREIDVVQELGDKYALYEIKSSMTFKNDFVANINYFKDLFPGKVVESSVVYDGETIPPVAFNYKDI